MKLRSSLVVTLLMLGACAHHSDPKQASSSSQNKTSTQANSASTKKEASKAPSEQTPVTKGAITVVSSTACRSVEKRGPVGEAESFPGNVGRVYLFTHVKVDGSNDASIQHIWNYKDKKMATVTLPIHGPQWRTYSSKVIDPSLKGEWKVDITTSTGELIKSQTFKIE